MSTDFPAERDTGPITFRCRPRSFAVHREANVGRAMKDPAERPCWQNLSNKGKFLGPGTRGDRNGFPGQNHPAPG